MTKEEILKNAIVGVVCDELDYEHGNFQFYKEEVLQAMEDYTKSKNERLIAKVETRVVKCILDDIDFGYDLATIKGKIKSGSYVGNSPETFTENERLKAEREWISTKDNPPKNRQNILAWKQETDMGWIVPLCWNIHAFTHEEFPYYMIEPQPPKQ